MGKRKGAIVDGVLLFDKPAGLTSNGSLQRVRHLFGAAKAGHTGTLDPMATGLLPVTFGEATKFSQLLLDADKRYLAELCLGTETDSGDAEGAIIGRREVCVDDADIEAALSGFRGAIAQVPPMYSALKRGGRPLYELAREGITVEREARQVTIYALNVVGRSATSLSLDVACSKGTYIRSLAMDLGRRLGCGAHLTGLRRVSIAGLDVAQAVSLEALEACEQDERLGLLRPVDSLAQVFPAVELDDTVAKALLMGQNVACDSTQAGCSYRVYGQGRFLGLGLAPESGRLLPRRLIATTMLEITRTKRI